MKKIATYIYLVIVLSTLLTACTDDYNSEQAPTNGRVSMKLTLNLPAGEASTRTASTSETDNGLAPEREIVKEDLNVLVFEAGVLKENITDIALTEENGYQRTLTAKSENSYKNQIEIVILANVKQRNASFNANSYIGQSKEDFYKALTFEYTQAWDILNTEERIPMWGAFTITPSISGNNVAVNLYRAIAKMNVQVDPAVQNFTLKSVYVYYANKGGFGAPQGVNNGESVTTPTTSSQFGQFAVTEPLKYEVADGRVLENAIYVPESNNNVVAEGKKALCLVVGGIYTGAGLVDSDTESFYRVDLKNDEGVYDVLRNYLYLYNIRKVSSPGTTTPEEALDHAVASIEIDVKAWDETALRGITNQYTLTTDKSRVVFGIEVTRDEEVNVTSDYGEDWTIPTETGDVSGTWFTLRKEGNKVIVSTKTNYGASREGSFYIQSGNLKKQIFVEQLQPGTANSYLVGEGEHEISVIVKGNGTPGLHAEDKSGTQVELDKSAVLDPAYLSIIWETHKGLVKLIKQDGSVVAEGADYNEETGRLKYTVNPSGAKIGGVTGGNALIGAFNANGDVIWSWHIWVAPDMKEAGFQDENWTLTGYKVMDRNLGAISNQPGVASLGLLYQWGRKDPMIGAAEISATSGRLETKNYLGHDWVVDEKNANNGVDFTIKNPTKLIRGGLTKKENDTKKIGPYLWGTNGGLNTEGVKELGKKTIYDPCPVGYRVPPVDAFVFKGQISYPKYKQFGGEYDPPKESDAFVKTEFEDWKVGEAKGYRNVNVSYMEDHSDSKYYLGFVGQSGVKFWVQQDITSHCFIKSSEKYNWNENLVYVPHRITLQKSFTGTIEYLYDYSGPYVDKAKHYGFYLNYQKNEEPKIKNGQTFNRDWYELEEGQSNISWLPISGAYEPEKGFTFDGVIIETGSTLTVNSFIWTNSSVKKGEKVEPAAMFLHGTEGAGGQQNSGRHIHGLTQTNINARPDYAGAVRCVRDEKKVFVNDNKVPENISLGASVESMTESTITSINDTWRVIDPGAHWFKITPDQGYPDKGKGTAIKFTVTEANPNSVPRTATVKVKFTLEDTPRTITVTQQAK